MQRDDGTFVAGYRLTEVLGSGPFGQVYRAVDAHRVPVCIKLLRPEFFMRQDGAAAFARLQASIAVHAQLHHPAIGRVFGAISEPSQGWFGQVSEEIPGRPLASDLFHKAVLSGDPIALAEVLGVFEQLCGSLAWLHQQGMVHGNVKPNNVLLNVTSRQVKLVDLSWSAIGVAAMPPGPDSFVSPEQYSGTVPTAFSDQWACATMLERLLTGGMRKLSFGVFPAPLVQTIQQATQDDPSYRFASMDLIAQALRGIRDDLLRSTGDPVGSGGFDQNTLPAARVPGGIRPLPNLQSPQPQTKRGSGPAFTTKVTPADTLAGVVPMARKRRSDQGPGERAGADTLVIPKPPTAATSGPPTVVVKAPETEPETPSDGVLLPKIRNYEAPEPSSGSEDETPNPHERSLVPYRVDGRLDPKLPPPEGAPQLRGFDETETNSADPLPSQIRVAPPRTYGPAWVAFGLLWVATGFAAWDWGGATSEPDIPGHPSSGVIESTETSTTPGPWPMTPLRVEPHSVW